MAAFYFGLSFFPSFILLTIIGFFSSPIFFCSADHVFSGTPHILPKNPLSLTGTQNNLLFLSFPTLTALNVLACPDGNETVQRA